MGYDFAGVAAAALRDAHRLVPAWLPDGRSESNEWVAVNPRRPSSDGSGAFRVNLHTGAWADFGGDAKGGDLISLLAYVRGIRNSEACTQLATELGIEARTADGWKPKVVGGTAARRPAPADGPHVDEHGNTLVLPAPPDAPPYLPELVHQQLGPASRHWPYLDRAGLVLQVVARFEEPARGPGEKAFLPFTLWRQPSGKLVWRRKGIPSGRRPLYHLDLLALHHDAIVIVCEGEKAADAAAELRPLPGFVCTTSPHGSRSAASADWSPLAGRRVVIWPDHDAAGIVYAGDVERLLRKAGARSVQTLGFDLIARELTTAQAAQAGALT